MGATCVLPSVASLTSRAVCTHVLSNSEKWGQCLSDFVLQLQLAISKVSILDLSKVAKSHKVQIGPIHPEKSIKLLLCLVEKFTDSVFIHFSEDDGTKLKTLSET